MATRRQKRLSRAARLQSATCWIGTYSGRDLVRGYRKWYGVSEVCAILELRMLGVDIPDARLDDARRNERDRAAARQRRPTARTDAFHESDETFAFIAGYTDGGAPYGITWEEMERDSRGSAPAPEPAVTAEIRRALPRGTSRRA